MAWLDRPDVRDPVLALIAALNIVIGVLVAQRVISRQTMIRLLKAKIDEMKPTQLEAFGEVLGLVLKSVEDRKGAEK